MLQVIKCKTEIEEALQIFYTDNTVGFQKKIIFLSTCPSFFGANLNIINIIELNFFKYQYVLITLAYFIINNKYFARKVQFCFN